MSWVTTRQLDYVFSSENRPYYVSGPNMSQLLQIYPKMFQIILRKCPNFGFKKVITSNNNNKTNQQWTNNFLDCFIFSYENFMLQKIISATTISLLLSGKQKTVVMQWWQHCWKSFHQFLTSVNSVFAQLLGSVFFLILAVCSVFLYSH